MKNLFKVTSIFVCYVCQVFADPATECNGNNQIEIGSCVSETLHRVDHALDVYLSLAKKSAADLDTITGRELASTRLEASQSAWIEYRNSHCAYVGAMFGGGSGTGIAINSCRIKLGRERSNELRDYLQ